MLCGLLTVSPLQGLAQEKTGLPLEELQMFSEVFGKIKREYVDEVDDRTLLIYAIRGMLSGLDAHSVFLSPEEFAEMNVTTYGHFGGIGIEITSKGGFIEIVAPLDDTPAYDAGLQSGDVILEIDGESAYGMTLREAVDLMRGEPGTTVRLTIGRKNESDPFEIELARAVISTASVRSEMLEPGYGYLRVSSFQSDTAQSLRSQIKDLADLNGGGLSGLVLDLRSNPGGVLTGAVEISDMFLKQGNIVSTRGRTPESRRSFSAKPDDVIQSTPMVVLVDRGSASASEIVAGALQDHKRAVILGMKSFGKGSVQSIFPMENGGAVKLTTARYYTPGGRSIQDKGITPDIIADRPAGTPADRRAEPGEEYGQDTPENRPSGNEDRNERIRNDPQLLQALNVLKGMAMARYLVDPAGG